MAEKLPPPLEGADAPDALGGFTMGRLNVSSGHELATYTWTPACGLASSVGVVHMLHGVFAHTLFEWLTPDAHNYRNTLAGSVIASLLDVGLVVIGHDHPGHGRSSGLHGYVDTFDHLRDGAAEVARHFGEVDGLAGKPRFLVGMSMGATTAIQVARKFPELFEGFALVSPAVRQPDDLFGWWGTFLKAINVPLGWLVPRLAVLKLPSSEDPVIRDAVAKDALIYRGAMRVRLGQEFLRTYDDIDANADSISFAKVAVMCGVNDNIVSPSGMKKFFSRIRSEDKTFFDYANMRHEILREKGCDSARADLVAWIKERIPKP